ncbi:hypothetical protein FACS1894164_09190 [Spirochaetia bacterium]|nr:hypothetical protein FACS1894164_09190 [Spirochaetia bacterium]
MSNEVSKEMHKIRAKLYPNYLKGHEGTYIARTQIDATLSVEKVCIAATTRGKASQPYEVMVHCVNDYLDEALYQLADGFSVENKLCSVHPKFGGFFDKLGQVIAPAKHKISFAFRAGSALHALCTQIEIVIEGIANTSGYIGKVEDIDSATINQTITPGGIVIIEGNKIKLEGDNPEIGVYFINQADGNKIKVTKHLAENRDKKVIAVVPADIHLGTYQLEIVTQYTKGTRLKEPRHIIYGVDLTAIP